MLKLSAVCLAVSVLAGSPAMAAAGAPAAQSQAALGQRIDALIAPSYKANEPGATVIVVKDGKTVLRKAYGLADSAANKPMTPDMTMRLGSITKQFTAVAVLMLAEEGKLSLSDDITRFFPDYPTNGKKITVEHLLTHTSGIKSYTSKPDYVTGMAKDMSVSAMIDGFKNDPLDFEPGLDYRYNNSGYLLLGGAFPFGHCSIPCTHRSGPYRPAKIFGGRSHQVTSRNLGIGATRSDALHSSNRQFPSCL